MGPHKDRPFRRYGPTRRPPFRHFLVFRMLLVLLAAGLLVNFTVGASFRLLFSRDAHASLERNAVKYAHYLADEMGSPLDTAKARQMALANSLQIRYDDPGMTWATTPDLPALPRLRGKDLGLDQAGWSRGRLVARVEKGSGIFLIAADMHNAAFGHWEYLGIPFLVVSLVLFGAFLAMRRLLAPLKGLTAAVDRMGRGELGHQVPVCGRDELGRLASSFNAMSTRLAQSVLSREQLLLDVSHELRSPLTRIRVALEMAGENPAMESIRDDLGEMEGMIGEILETARLDSAHGKLNLEDVDLGGLAEEAVQGVRGRPPGVELTRPREPGAGLGVKADRERVKKVLANVLDNALKYSQESRRPVEMALGEEAEGVVFRIRDHGQGIPSAELPRLFEPFYRVDRSRSRDTGGYGLGLSLCKRIMEAHGGRISMASEPGQGTEVTLVFPRSPEGT